MVSDGEGEVVGGGWWKMKRGGGGWWKMKRGGGGWWKLKKERC